MSHSYSNIDFDPSVFPHPHQSCPSGHATSLPPYLSDPPPSYYSPPIAPPSYSFPQKTYDPQPVPDLKAGILQTPPAISSFPDDGITFSPSPRSVEHPARDTDRTAGRITIAHPYARLYAKKDGSKRRKIWNHVLEKQLFSPQELFALYNPPSLLNFIPFPSDPPWVHLTDAPYISPPLKHTLIAFTTSYWALAFIRYHLTALNRIAALIRKPQRYTTRSTSSLRFLNNNP